MLFNPENVNVVTVAWALLLIGGTWAFRNQRIKEFLVIALVVALVLSHYTKRKEDEWIEEPALAYLENELSQQDDGAERLEKWKERFPGLAGMTMGDVVETMYEEGIQQVQLAVVNKQTDHLIVQGVIFGKVAAEMLSQAIRENYIWKRVSFIQCSLDPTSALTIGQGFRENQLIYHVDFDQVLMNQETLQAVVSKLVIRNKAIQILSIESCGIDDEGAAHLSNAMRESSTLQTLSLKGNDISSDMLSIIEGAVPTLLM